MISDKSKVCDFCSKTVVDYHIEKDWLHLSGSNIQICGVPVQNNRQNNHTILDKDEKVVFNLTDNDNACDGDWCSVQCFILWMSKQMAERTGEYSDRYNSVYKDDILRLETAACSLESVYGDRVLL